MRDRVPRDSEEEREKRNKAKCSDPGSSSTQNPLINKDGKKVNIDDIFNCGTGKERPDNPDDEDFEIWNNFKSIKVSNEGIQIILLQ